jgi:RND family efflux transporter MFP subunit
VREQFDARLATQQELSTATQAAELAKLRAASLRERGAAEGPRDLLAGVAGIVTRVAVQQGQVTPAGGALAEIVPNTALVAKLGLEPSERITPGQAVELVGSLAGADSKSTEGRVRLVANRVSADTRRIEVFVSLPPDHPFVLDTPLTGTWTEAPLQGLVVPRLAVLPTDDGQTLFTVTTGHAHRHVVKVLAADGDRLLVAGEGLKDGDEVVAVGNLELEDGMEVSTESVPATATSPAATGATTDAPAGAER